MHCIERYSHVPHVHCIERYSHVPHVHCIERYSHVPHSVERNPSYMHPCPYPNLAILAKLQSQTHCGTQHKESATRAEHKPSPFWARGDRDHTRLPYLEHRILRQAPELLKRLARGRVRVGIRFIIVEIDGMISERVRVRVSVRVRIRVRVRSESALG